MARLARQLPIDNDCPWNDRPESAILVLNFTCEDPNDVDSNPEAQARRNIDDQLAACGWVVQNRGQADITAALGVAIREMRTQEGDWADYLLYADEKVIGVVEAKKEGHTLTGVEVQSDKYSKDLPANLPAYHRPLPFVYQTTGAETRFTNLLDRRFMPTRR